MITLRRAKARHHHRGRQQETWFTFFAKDRADPLAGGFGMLQSLNEDRLSPSGRVAPLVWHDADIVTYVREGALAFEDSTGRSGVIHAGEFELATTRSDVRHSETNASPTDSAHIFQILLARSGAALEPSRNQKRFSAAERRGILRLVASPDARGGSLPVHQDALVYSAMLDRGQHVVHELSPGRSSWLHVVAGEVAFGDIVLTTGDGAGISNERAVSLTAKTGTEILLFDLGQPAGPVPSERLS